MLQSPWFVRWAAPEGAGARLFCLPWAGGSSTGYRAWARRLPAPWALCPVELPGRGARLLEPAEGDLDRLVEALRRALDPLLDQPFALFGHSMGALVAYALARALPAERQPALLVVSGFRAPDLPDPEPPRHALPRGVLIDELRTLGGTPEALFAAPDLLDMVLPTTRADLRITETYAHRPGPALACPILALGGVQDPSTPPELVAPWARFTRGGFALRLFEGDHFYQVPQQEAVLRVLGGALQAALAAGVSR